MAHALLLSAIVPPLSTPSARRRPTQATRAAPSLQPPPPRRSPHPHSLTVVLPDSPAQVRLRERLPRQGCGRAAVLGHQVQHVPAVTKPCGWAKWTASGRDGAAEARRNTSCPHTPALRAIPLQTEAQPGARRTLSGSGGGGGGSSGPASRAANGTFRRAERAHARPRSGPRALSSPPLTLCLRRWCRWQQP